MKCRARYLQWSLSVVFRLWLLFLLLKWLYAASVYSCFRVGSEVALEEYCRTDVCSGMSQSGLFRRTCCSSAAFQRCFWTDISGGVHVTGGCPYCQARSTFRTARTDEPGGSATLMSVSSGGRTPHSYPYRSHLSPVSAALPPAPPCASSTTASTWFLAAHSSSAKGVPRVSERSDG